MDENKDTISEKEMSYLEQVYYYDALIETKVDIANSYYNRAFAKLRIGDAFGAIDDSILAITYDHSIDEKVLFILSIARVSLYNYKQGHLDLKNYLEIAKFDAKQDLITLSKFTKDFITQGDIDKRKEITNKFVFYFILAEEKRSEGLINESTYFKNKANVELQSNLPLN